MQHTKSLCAFGEDKDRNAAQQQKGQRKISRTPSLQAARAENRPPTGQTARMHSAAREQTASTLGRWIFQSLSIVRCYGSPQIYPKKQQITSSPTAK
jgi:hypothetical protein